MCAARVDYNLVAVEKPHAVLNRRSPFGSRNNIEPVLLHNANRLGAVIIGEDPTLRSTGDAQLPESVVPPRWAARVAPHKQRGRIFEGIANSEGFVVDKQAGTTRI